jgi:hypothetical protein
MDYSKHHTILTHALEVSNHLDAILHLCGRDVSAIWAGEEMGLRYSDSGGEDNVIDRVNVAL